MKSFGDLLNSPWGPGFVALLASGVAVYFAALRRNKTQARMPTAKINGDRR